MNDRVQDTAVKMEELKTTIVPTVERSDIECGADTINIFLPSDLLSGDRNVTWRDDSCLVDFNGTHYVGSIYLSDCGTTVQIDDETVSFSNDLIVHSTDLTLDVSATDYVDFLPENSQITFGEEYETVIPVECVYPRHSNVSSSYYPIKQNVRFFEKRYGHLDLYMRQYENDSYTTPISDDEYPRMIPLGNDVYIAVGMNFVSPDLRVRLERCIATSTPSPVDKNWRELVNLGCPVNGVQLHSEPVEQDVKFTFKAFDFSHNSSGVIYIHCEATVCHATDPGCTMGCPPRARRSATEDRYSRAHLISTGPLLVDRGRQSSQEQPLTIPTVVAVVSLLVAMVAVILAVIGWTKRPAQKPQTEL